MLSLQDISIHDNPRLCKCTVFIIKKKSNAPNTDDRQLISTHMTIKIPYFFGWGRDHSKNMGQKIVTDIH